MNTWETIAEEHDVTMRVHGRWPSARYARVLARCVKEFADKCTWIQTRDGVFPAPTAASKLEQCLLMESSRMKELCKHSYSNVYRIYQDNFKCGCGRELRGDSIACQHRVWSRSPSANNFKHSLKRPSSRKRKRLRTYFQHEVYSWCLIVPRETSYVWPCAWTCRIKLTCGHFLIRGLKGVAHLRSLMLNLQ